MAPDDLIRLKRQMRVRLKHQVLAARVAQSQLSQNHWAIKLSLSRGHLSDLVNGKRPYPSGKVRRKLLDGLACEFDELFHIECSSGPNPSNVDSFSSRILDFRMGRFRLLLGRVSKQDAAAARPQRGRIKPMRNLWDSLRRDLFLGLRKLFRHPAYTASVALPLALGIASFATVFTSSKLSYFDPCRESPAWKKSSISDLLRPTEMEPRSSFHSPTIAIFRQGQLHSLKSQPFTAYSWFRSTRGKPSPDRVAAKYSQLLLDSGT